jgi:hypothetical protein
VAAIDNGTRAECMALRKLGRVIADGDWGELSVWFPLERFRDVARILKPLQASIQKQASKNPLKTRPKINAALQGSVPATAT